MLFSDTALSTSRFISPSVTKANRSPILTLILIVNLTRLEVFEIGKWGYIWSRASFRPIARERKYLMDYKVYYYSVLWCSEFNLNKYCLVYNVAPLPQLVV